MKRQVKKTTAQRSLAVLLALSACALVSQSQAQPATARDWIRPGQGGVLPAQVDYANPAGKIGILNADGEVQMDGHPFFTPLGTNGRACVTCHQPSDSMGLSLDSIRQQWQVTNGKGPLFSMHDGANCPNLPAATYA